MENIDHRVSHAFADWVRRSKTRSRLAVFGAVELIWFMGGLLFAIAMASTGRPEWTRSGGAAALLLVGGILVPWLTTLFVEYFVRRARPFQREGRKALIEMAVVTPSFPSGHATIAFAMVAVIAQMRPDILCPFLFAAAVIAVSRVGVGVHYVTDILAGATIGWFVGTFGYLLGIAFLIA